jgi:calcium-dependent protein kinase|eukprot:TRINITY_DN7506_c0_g1_i1.p1 TRINITY_DN7506_c0_g1~~TRINITY_DN7506_c0_g1_i1.p1  ORF type:complete len:505 (-),score=96.67 TRINITY_DN7506_c0_g1_i1:114-1628(-)
MGCGASANPKSPKSGEKSKYVGSSANDKKDKKGYSYIIDNDGKITDSYTIEKNKLGEGSYGSVCKCIAKETGIVRACKTIAKMQMTNLDRFKSEIRIMKMMDHPNIIKLFESFEDSRNFYLVMELCTGGELFDRIIDCGHFTEQQAAIVMQHIFRAMFYMHENRITHRDLKPENFLFTNKDSLETSMLKIIDFGLACTYEPGGKCLTTKAGTPYYVAPQVLAGKYDHMADLWSCGIIMYVMLCGYPPFYGETDAEVLAKIRVGNFTFQASDWKRVSEDAKQLIRALLRMNPKERYTADEALNHEWVKNRAPRAEDTPLQTTLVDNLKGFRSQNKLKKAALHVIASMLSESQIKALRDTFMALDKDGDGQLTPNELKEGLSQAGFTEIPEDLANIMKDVDVDGSGCIDYTEFLAATLDKKMYIKEDVCWAAFRVFDRDGNGKISKAEIAHVLGDGDVQSVANKDLAEIMKDFDDNGDGEIDFEEFMNMMRATGDRGSGLVSNNRS